MTLLARSTGHAPVRMLETFEHPAILVSAGYEMPGSNCKDHDGELATGQGGAV